MLLNNFYTILRQAGPEPGAPGIPTVRYRFTLELDPSHPVYEGHFPGNPVVPGVCQVQMISELVSETQGIKLRLIAADNIKFMSMIVPAKKQAIDAELQVKTTETGDISASATLTEGETTFLKFKGLFRKETE